MTNRLAILTQRLLAQRLLAQRLLGWRVLGAEHQTCPARSRRWASLGVAIAASWGVLAIAGCEGWPFNRSSGQVHLRLGNPSNAGAHPSNYLIVRPQYVLSYNRDRATANWASWQLNEAWLGDTDRQDDFREDPSLPSGWHQVDSNDYRGSGYDRGHLVPSADRTASRRDNSSTFLMTNIIPQIADNNREPWRELEEYCRRLVRQGKELYIIAGVYETQDRIADETVVAPRRTWKIVVVLDPNADIDDISASTRVIAVDIPNHAPVDEDWRTYRISVDVLEYLTGYDFLTAVPPSVQAVIESQIDQQ